MSGKIKKVAVVAFVALAGAIVQKKFNVISKIPFLKEYV